MSGVLALIGYAAMIPLANWAISQWGIVPIGFGLMAPAGVFFAGLSFTLRDLVQEQMGRWWTVGAIGAGALLSLVVSDPFVALASCTAFLLSELVDFAVYTPLRERGMVRAVVASNVVGSVVDSVLFLVVAGLPLSLVVGLTVGKWLTILPAVLVLWAWRRAQQPAGVLA